MRTLTLFWIDDMMNWAESAQENLRIISPKNNIDLRIIPAINGDDILQQCMMFNFDAIIMDYNMEPFNGDKYIADIRNEDHLQHIPIIFYSQDNNIDLDKLVEGFGNIHTVFRGNLEDKIKTMLFKKL